MFIDLLEFQLSEEELQLSVCEEMKSENVDLCNHDDCLMIDRFISSSAGIKGGRNPKKFLQ